VAGTIRTDGATVAATLLLHAVSRERPPASAMTTIALTNTERAYLQGQPIGRLATVDASGAPQNNPIGVFLDEETGDIVVGGHAIGATRKFRNVQANAQVAQPRNIDTRPAVNRVARHEVSPPRAGVLSTMIAFDESNDPKRSASQSCDPACTVAEYAFAQPVAVRFHS
jgi:hypothetical protein